MIQTLIAIILMPIAAISAIFTLALGVGLLTAIFRWRIIK